MIWDVICGCHFNRILSMAKILLVLKSHDLLSKKILQINLHILFIIHFKTSWIIQELQESIKYIKCYQQNKIVFLNEHIFYLYFTWISSKPDFQVNPWLNAFVSPVHMLITCKCKRILSNVMPHHATSNHIMTPMWTLNMNPKMNVTTIKHLWANQMIMT